ncbi:sigma-54-dependent transcriptional regulator [Anaeromyxobacter oryzae]|uniref:sigma-54-dependent transcriptional regulator n=1 Tax=Anaeromyxobacter oryzae TaxID=2918170 RepID=UPI0020BE922F|nr:sigma-54 dependent transcriptional regulator [Anaeromyxobacter oryzae]
MPRTRSREDGRRCLVLKPQPGGPPSARWLAAAGLTPVVATTEADALEALDREPLAAIFVAHSMGPVAVASLVARAGHQHPDVPVVVLGAAGTVQEAVDAMQQGAADYLAPPFDPVVLVSRLRKLAERSGAPDPDAAGGAASYSGLVGSSPAIRRVLTTLEKISRYKTNVLVLGESGTGKELIARALHARGPRRGQLFVPLNCATLGRELLENELFGHEKGAFTGANERKKGLFELADGGTLFLDEIAEMDPATQAKLLRVLERNEFRRVGGTGKVKVDLSVLAATNRNIEEAIASGKFREDLYYRLKVVTLLVPPLRERKEDIPALIDAFIADFNRRNDGKIRGISPAALKLVMEYDWPGNVRELKNAVESAAILASGETISTDGFSELGRRRAAPSGAGSVAPPRPWPPAAASGVVTIEVGATLADAERELIAATLHRYRNRREAARVLGLGLRTLYTKLRQYRLRPPGGDRAESA